MQKARSITQKDTFNIPLQASSSQVKSTDKKGILSIKEDGTRLKKREYFIGDGENKNIDTKENDLSILIEGRKILQERKTNIPAKNSAIYKEIYERFLEKEQFESSLSSQFQEYASKIIEASCFNATTEERDENFKSIFDLSRSHQKGHSVSRENASQNSFILQSKSGQDSRTSINLSKIESKLITERNDKQEELPSLIDNIHSYKMSQNNVNSQQIPYFGKNDIFQDDQKDIQDIIIQKRSNSKLLQRNQVTIQEFKEESTEKEEESEYYDQIESNINSRDTNEFNQQLTSNTNKSNYSQEVSTTTNIINIQDVSKQNHQNSSLANKESRQNDANSQRLVTFQYNLNQLASSNDLTQEQFSPTLILKGEEKLIQNQKEKSTSDRKKLSWNGLQIEKPQIQIKKDHSNQSQFSTQQNLLNDIHLLIKEKIKERVNQLANVDVVNQIESIKSQADEFIEQKDFVNAVKILEYCDQNLLQYLPNGGVLKAQQFIKFFLYHEIISSNSLSILLGGRFY